MVDVPINYFLKVTKFQSVFSIPNFSTPDFSTADFSTTDFSTLYFLTPDLFNREL